MEYFGTDLYKRRKRRGPLGPIVCEFMNQEEYISKLRCIRAGILSTIVILLCSFAQAADTPRLDEHDRLIVKGEPFFPLGLFVVHCTNGRYDKRLEEIADSPFDTVMNYAVNKCGSNAGLEEIRTYLDKLQSHNLKLIYSLKDYFGNGQKDLQAIETRVNAFRDHPAIISWYLNDELPPKHIPELQKRYDLIKRLDPRRPVWSVHWNSRWLLAEAHTTDIVGADPYPIGNLAITLVSWMADRARGSGKPLWLVPQIFDWSDYPADHRAKTGRPPTFEEMRAMTYLATNHGAKGLIYYSYFNIRDDDTFDVRWPQIKKIASEVKQLKPVFLSTDKIENVRVDCDDDAIDFKLMKKDNQYYLFAVNTLDSILNDVPFEQPTKTTKIDVLFEKGRSLSSDKSGGFTDDFAPYEVHIYRWGKI